MLVDNPIILKELVLGARRRHMYVVRAVLPALAIAFLVMQVPVMAPQNAQEWRQVAQVAGRTFITCAWMGLLVFSLLAAVYSSSSLSAEWTRGTMEVLCVTPVSPGGIVYGKFASALARVFLIGIGLLPVMGLWFHLGRIGTEVALGSLGVIASSVVMFGALGLVQAAALRPRKPGGAAGLDFLLLYLSVPVALGVLVWKNHPNLVAAVPPWAFYYVINDRAPGAMAARAFALLTIEESLGVAALALLAAPVLFHGTVQRYVDAGDRVRGLRAMLPRRVRRWLQRRPRMGARESPFYWQEKGAPTRMLRCIVWLTYGLIGGALIVSSFFGTSPGKLLSDAGLYVYVAGVGVCVLSIVSLMYGLTVFSREKAHNTARALILTGVSPGALFLAKIRAVFWALRYPLVGIAAPAAAAIALDRDLAPGVVALVGSGCLVWPLVCTIIGMGFGAIARSFSRAVIAVLLAPLWACVYGAVIAVLEFALIATIRGLPGSSLWRIPVQAFLAPTLLLSVCVIEARSLFGSGRVWGVWRMSALLGFSTALMFAFVWYGQFLGAVALVSCHPVVEALVFAGLSVVAGSALSFLWLGVSLRNFEDSMIGEQPR